MLSDRVFAIVILAVQVGCAAFFLSDILLTLFGINTRPIPWEVHELLEIAAAFGLTLSVVLGAIMLRRTFRRQHAAEEKLRRASGEFMALLAERFADWGLTPAEQDVALFAIKGMSTAEIATLRATSEGTVKAQTNAIYRKAGVSGRPQLLSLFIDDLMDGEAAPVGMPPPDGAGEPFRQGRAG